MSRDLPHRGPTGEPMRCPSCDDRLIEVERADVLIDACPSCRGVWLDRGELDKILVNERKAMAGDPDDNFLAEVEGRRARPQAPAPPPRHDDRHHDDRHRDDRRYEDDKARAKRKRKSFLEDLLDF